MSSLRVNHVILARMTFVLFRLLLNRLGSVSLPSTVVCDLCSGSLGFGYSCLLEGDLQQLSTWAKESRVSFNPSKSAALLFNGKSQNKPLCPLRLNDEPVPHKSSKRHLGVVLLESLRWDDHVSQMLKSVRAPLALCNTLAYRHRLPVMTIRHFYCAVVRPLLEYCSAVWHGCTCRLQACLERVQLELPELLSVHLIRTPRPS